MNKKQLFWLHIWKSGGTSTRPLLQPYYVSVDRGKKPKNFIQARPEEYNDILNNFRVVLGEYQFRRSLFAKEYLFPENWDDIFSFAFSREPVDRCVSMFYYLFWNDRGILMNIAHSLKQSFKNKKLRYHSESYSFDVFLEYVQEARLSDSIYLPFNTHFTTHTATMWDDITDLEGKILLKQVYRLENLTEGINQAFEQCGISKRLDGSQKSLNKNSKRGGYVPNKSQKQKIEELYRGDFEIYEGAWYK